MNTLSPTDPDMIRHVCETCVDWLPTFPWLGPDALCEEEGWCNQDDAYRESYSQCRKWRGREVWGRVGAPLPCRGEIEAGEVAEAVPAPARNG
uniref:Uncharacterized protein n=1 Tax=Candidatus Kentrum sp. LPFa TaxID=2126335 RepID=A0A450WD56_9GAMM|nr:MAG: hypothetical protein BECKLPF1236B_GA0070989_10713 [Candidatus Kentron sp. LPFa]